MGAAGFRSSCAITAAAPAGNGGDPAAAGRGALGDGGAGGAGAAGGVGGGAEGRCAPARARGTGGPAGSGGPGDPDGVGAAGRAVPGNASAAGGGGGSCDTSGTPSMGTDLVSRHGSPRRIPSVPVGRDALGMIVSRDPTSSGEATGGGCSGRSAARRLTAASFSKPRSARNSVLWSSRAPGSRNRVTQRANRAASVSCVDIGPVNLGGTPSPGNAAGFREVRAKDRYSLMLATAPIVRALRAAHLHDAPRVELLRLACEKIRALGAPYTSVY